MTFNRIFSAALAATLLAAGTVGALAADAGASMQMNHAAVAANGIAISGAFARATPPGAPVGGGYLTITNNGATADRLLSASSPAAGAVSLHEMKMQGDVMKMRDLADGIDIPAGGTVTLTPSGLHMMFEHLHGGFVQGKTVPVTLTFQKAGAITVKLDVLGIAASAPAAAKDSMDGMKM